MTVYYNIILAIKQTNFKPQPKKHTLNYLTGPIGVTVKYLV